MYNQPQLKILEQQTQPANRFGNNISALINSQDESKNLLKEIVENTSILAKSFHANLKKQSTDESFNFEGIQTSIEKQQSKAFSTLNALDDKVQKGFDLDWIDKFQERLSENHQDLLDKFIDDKSDYYGFSHTETSLMHKSANVIIGRYKSVEHQQLAILSGIYDIQRYSLSRLSTMGSSSGKSNPIDLLSNEYHVGFGDKLGLLAKSISPKIVTKAFSFLSPVLDIVLDPKTIFDKLKLLPYKITNKLGIGLKDAEGSTILKKAGLYETTEQKAYDFLAQAFPELQEEQRRIAYSQLETQQNIYYAINTLSKNLTGTEHTFINSQTDVATGVDRTKKLHYDSLTAQYIDDDEHKKRTIEREKQIKQEVIRDKGIVTSTVTEVLSKIPGIGKYIPSINKISDYGKAALHNQVAQGFKDKQEDIYYRNIGRDIKDNAGFRKITNIASAALLGYGGLLSPLGDIIGGVNHITGDLPFNIANGIFGGDSPATPILGTLGSLGIGSLISNKLITGKKVNIGKKIYNKSIQDDAGAIDQNLANLFSQDLPIEVIMNILSSKNYDNQNGGMFLSSDRSVSDYMANFTDDDKSKLQYLQAIMQERDTSGLVNSQDEVNLQKLLNNLKKNQMKSQLQLSALDMADSVTSGVGSFAPIYLFSKVFDQLQQRYLGTTRDVTARSHHFNNPQEDNLPIARVEPLQTTLGPFQAFSSISTILAEIKEDTDFGTERRKPLYVEIVGGWGGVRRARRLFQTRNTTNQATNIQALNNQAPNNQALNNQVTDTQNNTTQLANLQ